MMTNPPPDQQQIKAYKTAFEELVNTVTTLKNPGGCPWDAKQTHKSLRRYLLEEVCEVLEALDTDNLDGLEEELGDMLIHILFQADIAARKDEFNLASIMHKAAQKLQHRHPHVFEQKDSTTAIKETQVEDQWERIKRAESGRNSILKSFPPQLSAIVVASSIQKRAVSAGLQLATTSKADLSAQLQANQDATAEQQAGDLLMALVHEITQAGIDPESALRGSVRRLKNRITDLEKRAGAKPLDTLSPDTLKSLSSDSSVP